MYNAQNFTYDQLGTASAYYRVKGVASIRCPGSVDVGLIGNHWVQLFFIQGQPNEDEDGDVRVDTDTIETSLSHAGQKSGSISWDLGSVTEEGKIR